MTMYWAWFVAHGRTTPKWSFFGLTPPHRCAVYLSGRADAFSLVGDVAPSRARVSAKGIHRRYRVRRDRGLFALARRNENFSATFGRCELYGVFAVPLFLTLFFLAILTFAGISSRWTNDEDREWWGRAAGWLLAVVIGWMLISGLVIFGPLLSFKNDFHSERWRGRRSHHNSCQPKQFGSGKCGGARQSRTACVDSLQGRYDRSVHLHCRTADSHHARDDLDDVATIGDQLHFYWNLDAVSSRRRREGGISERPSVYADFGPILVRDRAPRIRSRHGLYHRSESLLAPCRLSRPPHSRIFGRLE